jgi:NAD+ synthase (glutamine-hydrolysing)
MRADACWALAQLNLWVGDVAGNVDKIIHAASEARDRHGASLLVCPELSLLGYPPDDLLLRRGLPTLIDAEFARLRSAITGITVVVGGPAFEGGQRFNAAWALRDGEILAHYRKQHLPNYGVFDERRHFDAGTAPCVFTHDGVRVALTICEDIWSPHACLQARDAGAELIVSLNASPFEQGKADERHSVARQRVAETGLPLLYVNAVGGQDEVVFDGHSFALDAEGLMTAEAASFVEGVVPLTLMVAPSGARQLVGEARADVSADAVLYGALVQATRDYVNRNGFPGALVGLSGGIDSALVAAIATDALGASRVWGVSLPSRYTADMSNDDARLEAEALGIRYDRIAIEPAFEAFNDMLAPVFTETAPDVTEENLQSRSRGTVLMALSNKFGHVVLPTGNKSEMAVGYATLYGDMCGGFAPLKDVYKQQVYALARYRNSVSAVIPERVITRPPSAELRPDQRDDDSLPPYEVLDLIVQRYVEAGRSIPDLIGEGFDEAAVRRVVSLVRRSEYKRRQSAPGPKVTPRAFGRERRYPITALYGDL